MGDEHIDLAAAREQTLEVIRKEYPPLLTSHTSPSSCNATSGRYATNHRGELPAVRWGQQFRFFREEVLAVLLNRPA